MATHDQNFYVQRTFMLPRTSKLTEDVIQRLDHILDFAPPEEYRDTLIEIYHTYIRHEYETLPLTFEEMADQMYFLMEFLSTASREMNGVERTKL